MRLLFCVVDEALMVCYVCSPWSQAYSKHKIAFKYIILYYGCYHTLHTCF